MPVELRLENYAELLQHDGRTRKSLWPHIIAICRQFQSEAQKVIDDNSKNVALGNVETGQRDSVMRFGTSQKSYELRIPDISQPYLRFDATFESIPPLLEDHTYLIVYINMTRCEDRTWKHVNQQLYLLVSAVALTKTLHTMEVRIERHIEEDRHDLDYYAILRPLRIQDSPRTRMSRIGKASNWS